MPEGARSKRRKANTDYVAAVATVFARRRNARDMTLIELAQRTGISKSSLARYERGEIVPSLWHARLIAIATGTDVVDMIRMIDEEALRRRDGKP